MEKLYIISKCIGVHGEEYHFHFNGVYKGEKIDGICINGSSYQLNEYYIVEVQVKYISEQTLYCKSVRLKKIFD